MLTSLMRVEKKYLNGQMPIAPGGWCWCTCCWCWCHCIGGAVAEEEEL